MAIRGDAFLINGEPTYKGRTWNGKKIEGLLMNSRMVQATFDDLNPETVGKWAYPDTKKWDADRNTREFVAAMPEWRKHGLLAFTLNLQGGSPRGTRRTSRGTTRPSPPTAACGRSTWPGWRRSSTRPTNSAWWSILGIFYFGQDERLKDEDAVKRATTTPSTGCSTRATATC